MQTLQFTRALRKIVQELKAVELKDFLAPLLIRTHQSAVNINEDQRDNFSALILSSQVGFTRLSEDPQIQAVMEALNISKLYGPKRVGKLIRSLGVVTSVNQLAATPDIYIDFFTVYDALDWLVMIKDASTKLLEEGKLGPSPADADVLELRLLDYENTGVDIERVQQFFTSINNLHTHLTLILNNPESHLKILYVDSGSDLYVGFQCAKAVMDIMRGLFSEFWERYKYSQFDDFNKKIDSLTKGLSFVGAVKEQVDNKTIDEETAKNLTYRVLADMTTLVGIGAALPEYQSVRMIDQRKELLAGC
jgi:hypothetical protein